MSQKKKNTKNKQQKQRVPPAAAASYYTDSLGFLVMDKNVPGLSNVILEKLNLKSYEEYRSALTDMDFTTDFGIRTYYEMFQKMEDTYKFCVQCKKLPSLLSDPRSMRRCKR
ncbi:hypothetical protein GDO86_017643 [Hymenochirus boettgeri]|uniref:Uncharacterized protein n=1 Tax=Hymenochirus boettgeri TaxID=247094 RepID=A0A8T2IQU5_9PIPI|nr:hypothetical protein GDO86_017643 [Hymenochirus boettgeri]